MTISTGLQTSQTLNVGDLRHEILRLIPAQQPQALTLGLAMIETLGVLYGGLLRVSPTHADNLSRDKLIISPALPREPHLAALALAGFFHRDWLNTLQDPDSPLRDSETVPGMDANVGLQSGADALNQAFQFAIADRDAKRFARTYVMLSADEILNPTSGIDGILRQIGNSQLDHFILLILPSTQPLTMQQTLNQPSLVETLQQIGWTIDEADINVMASIHKALFAVPQQLNRPTALLLQHHTQAAYSSR